MTASDVSDNLSGMADADDDDSITSEQAENRQNIRALERLYTHLGNIRVQNLEHKHRQAIGDIEKRLGDLENKHQHAIGNMEKRLGDLENKHQQAVEDIEERLGDLDMDIINNMEFRLQDLETMYPKSIGDLERRLGDMERLTKRSDLAWRNLVGVLSTEADAGTALAAKNAWELSGRGAQFRFDDWELDWCGTGFVLVPISHGPMSGAKLLFRRVDKPMPTWGFIQNAEGELVYDPKARTCYYDDDGGMDERL
ncbi:hypothetical protein QBC47DRAFT_440357 [Echria macrotheca]|uniref:Uncharacterized protein n=1 Tax=Echria macrotheca TaxID=438768 RepID=A0AAJ0BHC7_9PEZI|nr:hypothetical protein QBC47DRAFT_440357 [Echria macrotheca]